MTHAFSSPGWYVVVGLVLLAVFGTVAGSCRGSKPEASAEQPRPDTVSNDTASADTTASDDTADADSNGARPGPIAPAPAPGTVRVRATVDSCDTTASPVHCRLQIEEILGYGSATPTISTGRRTVRFASGLLDKWAVDSLTTESHIYVLSHAGERPSMEGEDEESRVKWSAQSIERK